MNGCNVFPAAQLCRSMRRSGCQLAPGRLLVGDVAVHEDGETGFNRRGVAKVSASSLFSIMDGPGNLFHHREGCAIN